MLYPPARCTELPTLLSPEIPSERGTEAPSTAKPEQGTVLRGAVSGREGEPQGRSPSPPLPLLCSLGRVGLQVTWPTPPVGNKCTWPRVGCSPQAGPQTGMMGEQGGVAELWERRTGGAQDAGRTEGAPLRGQEVGSDPRNRPGSVRPRRRHHEGQGSCARISETPAPAPAGSGFAAAGAPAAGTWRWSHVRPAFPRPGSAFPEGTL